MFDSPLTETNKIFASTRYKSTISRIENHEETRIFCRHNMAHFLDVARIATILCQLENVEMPIDVIYPTALLHDIGRLEEIEKGTPHEIASVALAKDFLAITDFSEEEKASILDAIANHRNKNTTGFNRLFYMADKASRPCYACPAESQCHWDQHKKNLTILL